VKITLANLALTIVSAALATLTAGNAAAGEPADTIYVGGDVITMNATAPSAEALAVKDGRILAVGDRGALEAQHRGETTRVVDLGGAALAPGLIDAHSHFANALSVVDWVNVSAPPVGPVRDIPGIIARLQAYAAKNRPRKGEWIIAYGYDPNTLTEKRDVTRDDLDSQFPDNPVMLLHVSNHGCVLNSAGFRAAGIDASTPTPAGGVIARKPGSQEPAGLLMETAAFPVFAKLPRPSESSQLAAFAAAQKEYARNGYTTIQDGATQFRDYRTMRKAAALGVLYLDLVALPLVTELDAFAAALASDGTYRGRLRIAGVKCLTDGSPQGKTAYWTAPLLTGGPNGEKNWRGEPTLPYADFAPIVKQLVDNKIRVYSHANGDAAIDMVIEALAAAGVSAEQDRRDVVIHSQFMRPDQLDAYKKLGLTPSFFTNHTFYWGDVHVANTGEARAFFISPMAAARERGIRFSNHTDYTITPLDPMMTMWTAVTRKSRSGKVIGPDQRVDAATALRALTIDAAWQYKEDQTKGSLEPGKLADLVIFDRNPLKAGDDDLRQIRVVETIKEGQTVFRAR